MFKLIKIHELSFLVLIIIILFWGEKNKYIYQICSRWLKFKKVFSTCRISAAQKSS